VNRGGERGRRREREAGRQGKPRTTRAIHSDFVLGTIGVAAPIEAVASNAFAYCGASATKRCVFFT
jgi:hypothetical protein